MRDGEDLGPGFFGGVIVLGCTGERFGVRGSLEYELCCPAVD